MFSLELIIIVVQYLLEPVLGGHPRDPPECPLNTGFTVQRVFIRRRRSENSLVTTQNSPAKFRSFSERAKLFHNNSPSPATTIPNENPAVLQLLSLVIIDN